MTFRTPSFTFELCIFDTNVLALDVLVVAALLVLACCITGILEFLLLLASLSLSPSFPVALLLPIIVQPFLAPLAPPL